jgi:hypothetical protein
MKLFNLISRSTARIALQFLVAGLYGLYLLFPLRSWIRWTNFAEKPLPYIPYDDSFFYLMQIKNINRNNGAFGNPYLFEKAVGTYDVPDSFAIWFWSRAGSLLDLDTIQIYFIMTFFTGFFTYLVSLKICNFVGFNNLHSNSVSVLICFLIFPLGTGIARPSPTSLCLWLLLLGILFLSRAITSLKKLSIPRYLFIFCLMIFANPIYAIFLATLSFVYLIFFKDLRLHFLKFIIPIEIIGLGIIILTKRGNSESKVETIRRLGSLETHFPASAHTSLSIVFLIAGILIIPQVTKMNKIFMANCLTLLIVLNSQIISGVWWEFESHYHLIFVYFFALICAHLVMENLPKYQVRILALFVIVIFGSSGVNNLISLSKFTKEQSSLAGKDVNLVKELSKKIHINNVFLFPRRQPQSYPEIAFLLNEGFVYWHRNGGQWSLMDKEVLSRYGCTLDYSDFSNKILTEDANILYIHRFLNADAHFSKWYSLLEFFSLSQKYVSSQKTQLKNDFIFLQNNKADFCTKYKLDFVITGDNKIVPFDSNTLEVQSKGEFR